MLSHPFIKGVAVKKNAEIVRLAEQVTLAQNRVNLKQAIVTAMQAKSTQFASYLSQASDNKATALANYQLCKDAMSRVRILAGNFNKASEQACKAWAVASDVAAVNAKLIRKLIFTVEFINTVSQKLDKQKVLVQLVPDQLFVVMGKAVNNANNAVAKTLTALQSAYVAESTLSESKGIIDKAQKQAEQLRTSMQKGWNPHTDTPEQGPHEDDTGLLAHMHQAYLDAAHSYHRAMLNNESVTRQLTFAQSDLADATMQLNSYQAGLAAATAAAHAA